MSEGGGIGPSFRGSPDLEGSQDKETWTELSSGHGSWAATGGRKRTDQGQSRQASWRKEAEKEGCQRSPCSQARGFLTVLGAEW